ncbi:hypothetical protein B0H13DRAFT_1931299 [Mycena leptocephala]|nr:hypothetical protein B0H13DRAFT_1931299 [Mycena leptocephala]
MPFLTALVNSAYAEAQPPPSPVVMLVSVTDLHPPKLETLIMHENLPDTFKGPAPVAPALPSSSQESAPPSSSVAPSGREESPLTDVEESRGDSASPKIKCPEALLRKSLRGHASFLRNYGQTERDEAIEDMGQHFNLGKALKFQSDGPVKCVFDRMEESFPFLKQYTKNWPVRCLLQAHLKITSDGAKTAVITYQRASDSVVVERAALGQPNVQYAWRCALLPLIVLLRLVPIPA